LPSGVERTLNGTLIRVPMNGGSSVSSVRASPWSVDFGVGIGLEVGAGGAPRNINVVIINGQASIGIFVWDRK